MRIAQPDRILLQRFVADHAASFSGDVVDIGSANGRYRGLFTNAKTYRTLDIDPTHTPDIVGSVENIPLENSSVDGIVCTQVLGDVWNLEKAVTELARILRPGGKLLLTESLQNELHDEPYDYWRLTPLAWEKLLSPHFTLEILEARGGFFTLRAQNSIRRMIERHRLYERPFLGRVAGMYCEALTRIAFLRDRKDNPVLRRKFAIGTNIIATKK